MGMEMTMDAYVCEGSTTQAEIEDIVKTYQLQSSLKSIESGQKRSQYGVY